MTKQNKAADDSHPYKSLPDSHYWRQSVSSIECSELFDNWQPKFTISTTDKVITAGSCFAQHIGAWLKNNGFAFYDAEPLPYFVSEDVAANFGYGIYSARYGNQYTPKQMLQTLRRGFGDFEPEDDYWLNKSGKIIDPFRPQVEPNGFESIEHLHQDRQHHFSAVRNAFKEAQVLVFTLGLTECWQSSKDQAVFPLCPGVIAGEYAIEDYVFNNLSIDETRTDLEQFIEELVSINPRLKIILTVSPVPLVASFDGDHVLSASSYSKSVLRVACEEIANKNNHVLYFPSYEIITGPQAPNYFAEDKRSVTMEGVNQVMSIFAKTLAEPETQEIRPNPESGVTDSAYLQKMEQAISYLCDEEMLSR